MPRRPRTVLVVAAVLALCLPVGRLVTARVLAAAVECCCGPHAAHESCGCPDCPAGEHAPVPQDEDDGDDTPSMTACTGAPVEALVAAGPYVLPALPTVAVTWRAQPPRPPPADPPEPPPSVPEPPPPRPTGLA